MTLEKAVKLLEAKYEQAKKMEFVQKPLAWALYQVWKEVDSMKDKKLQRDVVEVVRCKDCIRSREDRDEETLFCMQFRDTVDEQAYCSYGIPPKGVMRNDGGAET